MITAKTYVVIKRLKTYFLKREKVGMTSVFSAEGKSIPCTVIEAGPCVVTQVKTIEKDGYTAIQLGFDDKKEKNTTKPLSGHFKKAGTTPKRKLVEFSGYDVEYKLGDVIDVNLFEGTEYVDVVGTSKGKGFQGVVLVLLRHACSRECVWVDKQVVTE